MRDPSSVCGWLWLAWLAYWLWAARGAAPVSVPEPRAQRLQHTVPAAVAAWLLSWHAHGTFLGAVWLSGPARWTGVALTGAGIAFSFWARRHLGRYWSGEVVLKEGHSLIRSGPYRWARHPIYTGVLAAVAGTAAAGGRVGGLLGLALLAAVFARKLRREETLLATRFGAEYEAYKREVGALLPRPPRRP